MVPSGEKGSLQRSAGRPTVLALSARQDAELAIAMMGAKSATRVPTASLLHLAEWLGWPDWLRTGTSLAGSTGPLPGMISRADDILIMANMVENADPFALAEAMLTRPRMPFGLAGELAALHGPDLGSAVRIIARGLAARNLWVVIETQVRGEHFEFAVRPAGPMGELFRSFALSALTLPQRAVVGYRGGRLDDMSIATQLHDFPEAQGALAAFGCRIEPGGEAEVLRFPRGWLDEANPHFDSAAWDMACARIAVLEREARGDEAPDPLRAFIVAQIDEMRRVPRLKQAAAHLGISTRTIVRSLARQDTSFHEIVEEERKARALALLADRSLSLADVAQALGFNHMSSFSRSFRDWFGDTPGNLRKLAADYDAGASEDGQHRRS